MNSFLYVCERGDLRMKNVLCICEGGKARINKCPV